jgi:hypothetical protein
MLFLVYPVESPTIYGGAEKNVHSLLRVGFKVPPFLTGLTYETSGWSQLGYCVS